MGSLPNLGNSGISNPGAIGLTGGRLGPNTGFLVSGSKSIALGYLFVKSTTPIIALIIIDVITNISHEIEILTVKANPYEVSKALCRGKLAKA